MLAAGATIATVAVAACDSGAMGPEPPGRPAVLTVTSDIAYDVEQTASGFAVRIPFRLVNTYGSLLLVRGCHEGGVVDARIALDRFEDRKWIPFWTPEGSACISPPLALEDGAKLVDTLEVEVCTAPGCGLPTEGARPDGVYRLRWLNLFTSDDGTATGELQRLAGDRRVSNAFELRGR